MERLVEPERRWLDLRPLGMIALAAALVWSTWIAFGTWHSVRVRPEIRKIKVTGSAKKRIVSDLIEWSATIEARAPDRTTAYKRLREDLAQAVGFLEAQGIASAEIQPQSATYEEEFETLEELRMVPGAKEPVRLEKKVSRGHVTRETIFVRSKDVARVERASREITSLLERGITISSEAPSYFYTRLGELKLEMLAAAAKDARARAEGILTSAGGSDIKRMIGVNMGIININPANSTETSHEGNNDRTSLEKDIITVVHAQFELDD
jgi:uncharacterized protein